MSLGLPNQTGWKNPGTRLSLPPGTHSRPEITKFLFVIQAVLHAFWGSNLNPHVSAVSSSLPELSLQPRVSLLTSWLHYVKKVIDLGGELSQKRQGSCIFFSNPFYTGVFVRLTFFHRLCQ